MNITEKIVPGPKATMRCCIYKERAIVNERIKVAMGTGHAFDRVIEVLDIACDECPGDANQRQRFLPGMYCAQMRQRMPEGRNLF